MDNAPQPSPQPSSPQHPPQSPSQPESAPFASSAPFAPSTLASSRAAQLQELQARVTPAPPPAPVQVIAGFWRRLAAYLLDALILGGAGYLAGIPLFDVFARLSWWGRPIGLGVALLYFGILNSSLGGGQTLGKRLMKIKVVDEKGALFAFPWTIIRHAFLALPFAFIEWALPGALTPSWFAFVTYYLYLGLGFATFYLVACNGRTRQSLHDLAVGSFVVRAESQGPPPARPVWQVHYLAVALWLLAALWLAGKFTPQSNERDLLAARQEIESLDHVRAATVKGGFFGMKILFAQASYDAAPADLDQAAAEVAETLVGACAQRAPEQDAIVVQIQYGYDLGFCFSAKSVRKNYLKAQNPAEWKKLMKAAQ